MVSAATTLRPRARLHGALPLRSPALYPDDDWDIPKAQLHERHDIDAYRKRRLESGANHALTPCARYQGHALVVERDRSVRLTPIKADNAAGP